MSDPHSPIRPRDATPEVTAGSPDRFGYEWARYSTILPESKDQLERWLGSTGLASFAGKRVLDVGCGMGRNPHWFLKAGAREVIGIDYDEGSLSAARKNLGAFSNARVERCSVYDLVPETFGAFDRVTCIGVLHHLAQPEDALRKMWACVAPEGDLVLWCYAREGNERLLPFIQALRAVGSRLPIGATHALARGITFGAWPAIQLLPWQTAYYDRLKKLSFGNVESIIFDQMLPRISRYWTRGEFEALLRALPGGDVEVEFVQGNSWHGRVRKVRGARGLA
jgi:2-polyprenyl-3-methyl-5-hydroxy-6-metoxy-1,4-benzoquinol methylase